MSNRNHPLPVDVFMRRSLKGSRWPTAEVWEGVEEEERKPVENEDYPFMLSGDDIISEHEEDRRRMRTRSGKPLTSAQRYVYDATQNKPVLRKG